MCPLDGTAVYVLAVQAAGAAVQLRSRGRGRGRGVVRTWKRVGEFYLSTEITSFL